MACRNLWHVGLKTKMQVDSKSGKQVEGGVCPKREKNQKSRNFP
jgi:hypothetical protein